MGIFITRSGVGAKKLSLARAGATLAAIGPVFVWPTSRRIPPFSGGRTPLPEGQDGLNDDLPDSKRRSTQWVMNRYFLGGMQLSGA